MGEFIIDNARSTLLYRHRDEQILLQPYGKNCLRCRMTRGAKFSEESWTLLPPGTDTCEIREENGTATITNGHISATLKLDLNVWTPPVLTYYRDGVPVLKRKYEGEYQNDYRHVTGSLYCMRALFEANDGEHFYGLGQEQEDAFDRKGGTTQLLHYNTKSCIPYVYSSLGYGFLWNSPATGRCETTRNHTMWVTDSAEQMDYLIFADETPALVQQKLGELTGFAPAFPHWASGFWQCKLRYESQDELLAAAREYKRRGIPISVIVIDFFHWTEQGEWKFDPRYWPDPAAMVRELDEMGIELMVSVWPTTNPNSENYRTMDDRNLLVRTENGQYGTFAFHGQQTFVDFENPEAQRFVWDKVRQNYYKDGICHFWLDEAEPEVHPQQMNHLHFYAGNGEQAALLYPYGYAQAFYEGLKSEGEREILSLARAAYTGSQRFGAAVWNGDVPSTWRALRQSVTSGLSMGVCGIPWWTTDIGGFYGGDIESEDFRELLVRWFQFGLFSPIMRLHGARNRTENQPMPHPGILEPSGGANEIWAFGDKLYPILKSLIEQRERLRPYIEACMAQASATAAPIMRPLYFACPDDPACYEIEDEYLFGGDILFAPILKPGCAARAVYLPAGAWVNARTGEALTGGRTVTAAAQLDEYIAFVREGADVLAAFGR